MHSLDGSSKDQAAAGNPRMHLGLCSRTVFPGTQDRVYGEVLACGDVSQLAFLSDALIGAVAVRLEQTEQVGH